MVAALDAIAETVEVVDKRWEIIQQAKRRTGLLVGEVIAAIRGGRIQIGMFDRIAGYAGLCVLKLEIDGMRPSPHDPNQNPMITATAFGREVGIRKTAG